MLGAEADARAASQGCVVPDPPTNERKPEASGDARRRKTPGPAPREAAAKKAGCAHDAIRTPPEAGPLRSRARARCLRDRLRRRPQEAGEPHDHRAGDRDPLPPDPSRRGGRRRGHRRRRRHADPDPGQVPAQGRRPGRLRASRGRPLRVLAGLPGDGRGRAHASDADHRGEGRVGGAGIPRLARGSDGSVDDRSDRALRHAGVQAVLRRCGRRARSAGLRAQALRDPAPDRERGRRARQRVPHPEPLLQDLPVQGHVPGAPDAGLLSRSPGPGSRESPRARPPALQHEHLPDLGSRTALPLPGAQRRDQHDPRQPELDERARGDASLPALRRRPAKALSGDAARNVGLRALRQRARVPASRGSRPAAGDADDDSGGLGERPDDVGRSSRLLRVLLVHDGALGRSGVDVLLERRRRRRRARPKRAAAVAVRAAPGRAPGDGVRGRHARDRSGRGRREGAPRAGPDLLRGPRGGAHRPRRGAEGSLHPAPPLPHLGGDASARARRSGRGGSGPQAESRDSTLAPADLRLHARRHALPARADGREWQGGARLDGRGRGARVPVRQAAAALLLLQAELRPGHESRDRLDPRATRDDPRLDARCGEEPARGDARARTAPASPSSGPARRRARSDSPDRRAGLLRGHAVDALQGARRR